MWGHSRATKLRFLGAGRSRAMRRRVSGGIAHHGDGRGATHRTSMALEKLILGTSAPLFASIFQTQDAV